MAGQGSAGARSPARRRSAGHPVLIGVVLALIVLAVLRAYVVETAYVPTDSMEPLLRPGDRLVVDRIGDHVPVRGEVVLFNGTTVFGGPDAPQPSGGTPARIVRDIGSAFGIDPGETDYVKRIVGVGGDQVRCCTADGRISVNGHPVSEPYVYPGEKPSLVRFDVRVPAGHVFVLGDHRSVSSDSRSHLGDPGGGMVPDSDLIGRVVWRYWPLGRVGAVPSTPAFDGVPAAR